MKKNDLEIRVICHNQYLIDHNKFQYFDINQLSLNSYSHPPHILKAGEVLLWTPLYMYVLIVSGVSDRNGKCTIQNEVGDFDGVKSDNLLWIEHFSPSAPINHRIVHCTYSVRNAERFLWNKSLSN